MARVRLRPEGDERFIYVAHRHWVALLLRALIPVAVALGAVLVIGSRAFAREPDFLGRQPSLFDPLNGVLFVSVLIMAGIAAYIWLDWRNDHLIISNKRVVHEDTTLWLAYKYETIPLDRIQNVNVRTENILQYVLNYGRVEIQAAGPTEPIVFVRAECPVEIQKRVMGEVQREKRSQEQKRLLATVERRLNPDAPPVAAIRTPVEDQLRPFSGALHALLPLAPTLQGGAITWHRHWIILLQQLVWPIITLLAWLALFFVVIRYNVLDPTPAVLTLTILFLAVLLFFFWQYENWRNDIYILEPSRIIDVQRLPFGLYEDRREATLGMIQNVNASSPNIIARLFGYGNVLIETAGATGNFTFDHVPDPDEVQRIVFEYRERFQWQQREREWGNTLNIVEMYYQASKRGNPPQP